MVASQTGALIQPKPRKFKPINNNYLPPIDGQQQVERRESHFIELRPNSSHNKHSEVGQSNGSDFGKVGDRQQPLDGVTEAEERILQVKLREKPPAKANVKSLISKFSSAR